MRGVETVLLLLLGDTEHVHGPEAAKEDVHEGTSPGDDGNNKGDVGGKDVALAVKGALFGGSIDLLHLSAAGEEAGGQTSPDAAPAVHSDGVNNVVELHHTEGQPGAELVDQTTDHADENGSPGGNSGAASSDGNKAAEGAVVDSVEVVLSRLLDVGKGHRRNRTSSGSKGGSDGNAASSKGIGVESEGEGSSAVEAVPSDPQEEGAEDLHGS